MPLVDYSGSSGSEDELEDGPAKFVSNGEQKKIQRKEEENIVQPLSRSLPSIKSSSGKVQILAPSFEDLESSDEEDNVKVKIKKPSATGSGLKSILPPAKSGSSSAKSLSSTSTTTSMIPNIVKRPSTSSFVPTSVSKKPRLLEDEESMEEEVDEECLPTLKDPPTFALPSVNLAPDVDTRQVPVVHDIPSTSATSASIPQMSEMQLKKAIAHRFGDQVTDMDDIQLVDINVNEHMSTNTDYLKSVSAEVDSRPDGPDPNPTVRRKHHITFLAHQAKQRELQLKNEWAANRATRQQSRAKYGW